MTGDEIIAARAAGTLTVWCKDGDSPQMVNTPTPLWPEIAKTIEFQRIVKNDELGDVPAVYACFSHDGEHFTVIVHIEPFGEGSRAAYKNASAHAIDLLRVAYAKRLHAATAP